MLAPTIEKLAGEYEGKVKIGKMNTDENQVIPGSLQISAIPTVLVFYQGEGSRPPGRSEPRDQVQGASLDRLSARRLRWRHGVLDACWKNRCGRKEAF